MKRHPRMACCPGCNAVFPANFAARHVCRRWLVGLSGNEDPGYKWIAEHPEAGEFYFRTKAEAERFVKSKETA